MGPQCRATELSWDPAPLHLDCALVPFEVAAEREGRMGFFWGGRDLVTHQQLPQ